MPVSSQEMQSLAKSQKSAIHISALTVTCRCARSNLGKFESYNIDIANRPIAGGWSNSSAFKS